MQFSKNKDVVAGVFLLLASATYFFLSFQIRLTNIDRLVGSRFFPQICGVLLMLLSCGLIADGLAKAKRAGASSGAASGPGVKPIYRNTVLVLVSYALYIALMDTAGFILSTFAYLFSQMIILHGSRPGAARLAMYAVITVLTTVAVYYLFNDVFYLVLPRGKLF